MNWQLTSLNIPSLTGDRLDEALSRLDNVDRPRLNRLWTYYMNPLRVDASLTNRPYRQAQEWGLPTRITGMRAGAEPFSGESVGAVQRKEVVIENDIAWRIDAMCDYLFGKPLVIRSSAADPNRRAVIDRLIQAILARNGGILFLQQLALLGAVYGFVDVLVKLDPEVRATQHPAAHPGQRHDERPCTTPSLGRSSCACSSHGSADIAAGDRVPIAEPAPVDDTTEAATATRSPDSGDRGDANDPTDTGAATQPLEPLIQRLARMIRFEIVHPSRAVPLLSPADYRVVDAYAQAYRVPLPSVASTATAPRRSWMQRLLRRADAAFQQTGPATHVDIVEIISPTSWQRYEDGELKCQGENSLGEIPLVHIQNAAAPFEYSGASDVEPLIPLQDELNTRLCDRAHRIALQSFKMYLAKGIENFLDMPVAPGRMWSTDNEQAEVQEFGGDINAPSESQHIADIREALDKVSGVSPVAAGAIKNRIGNLTSAAALRITLISLLARTDRKRTTYGAGIARLVDLSLRWLDLLGAFPTTPAERNIEIHWPSPLPDNAAEKLAEAEAKLRIGVPRQAVLGELGY